VGKKLFTFYETKQGDTFAIVSRRVYGTDEHEYLLRETNAGYEEPFIDGYSLTIPALQEAPKPVLKRITADGKDEIAIIINGKRFRYWTEVRFKKTLDSIDSVDFFAPFNSDSKETRQALKPFSYASVVVAVGGFPVFNGTMVVVQPKVDSEGARIVVSCYSKPGVLNDCTAPSSIYPLEFSGMRFNQIADKLTSTFGIKMIYESDVGDVFVDGVKIGIDSKIMLFLNTLAKQRNAVLTNNVNGDLVFRRSVQVGKVKAVAKLRQGFSPLVKVTPIFNPQKYYSSVTGLDKDIVELPGGDDAGKAFGARSGGKYTQNNPFLKNIHRPFVFQGEDSDKSDIEQITKTKAARMFANSASYDIVVSTWRDNNGNLWEPDTVIKLHSHDAMIYKEHDFIIRSVVFSETSKSKVATMNLILPGGFSAELPESLPWVE